MKCVLVAEDWDYLNLRCDFVFFFYESLCLANMWRRWDFYVVLRCFCVWSLKFGFVAEICWISGVNLYLDFEDFSSVSVLLIYMGVELDKKEKILILYGGALLCVIFECVEIDKKEEIIFIFRLQDI